MKPSGAFLNRFAFLSSLLTIDLIAGSPPISVSIQATWQEPPMLIQILESAALERPNLFFAILDNVCSRWPSSTNQLSTDQKIYEYLTEVLRSPGLLDGQGELESLEFSIALKEAQPKIEAFRAWYASLPLDLTHVVENSTQTTSETHDCSSWALINGLKICNASKLSELLESPQTFQGISSPPQILPFDHRSDQSSQVPTALNAVLYASADPASFCPFHQSLQKPLEQVPPKIIYTFRWRIPSISPSLSKSQSSSFLSGWGASLDVKKSEYLTLDDRPIESTPGDDVQLVIDDKEQKTMSDKHVESEQSKLKPLKAAEMLDIGAKATQHVLSSPSPLSTLRQLTENFPLYAHTLVNEWVPGKVSRDLRLELVQNTVNDGISAGESAVWMNGLKLSPLVSLENLNFFKLIEIMRNERQWMTSLASLGFTPSQARSLIMDETLNSAMNPEASQKSKDMQMDASSLGERFDASDRQEGGGAIIWLNDLESDDRYSMWPTTLRAILRPSFPGQLHAMARNLINVVLGLDLTRTNNLRTLGNIIQTFVLRLPMRWGVVPIPSRDSSDQELMSRCFWNLTETIGPIETLGFFKEFTENLESDSVDVKEFITAANERMPTTEKSTQELESAEEKFESWLRKSQLYASRLSLCSDDLTLPACMLVNGRFFPMDEDFRSNLQETAMLHTAFIQHQVYFNLLQDDKNVADYLYDLPLVHSSRNDLVYPSEAKPLRFVNLIDALDRSKSFAANRLFQNAATPSDQGETRSLASIWIIGNLDSDTGTAAVAAALDLLIKPLPEIDVQVSFVHAPPKDLTSTTKISESLAQLVFTPTDEEVACQDLIDQLSHRGHPIVPPDGDKLIESRADVHLILKAMQAKKSDVSVVKKGAWFGAREFANNLDVPIDALTVLINGRRLSVSPATKLTSKDLIMLVEYETQQRITPLIKSLQMLKGFDLAKQRTDVPLIMSIIGFVLVGKDDSPSQTSSSEARSSAYRTRLGNHSSYQRGDESQALFDFGVILNPASEAAQRWSALLERLSYRSDVHMKVWFNPSLELGELPIKRFFRTCVSNSLEFDTNGHAIPARVDFRGIPTQTLFTLAIDTPPAWLALPHDSIHDLDNIMLSELPSAYTSQGVEAIFQLEHIILGGHARELPSDMPPRGLQIVLTDLLRNQEVDTIIMANLGYFQFKSAPGLHRLSIRPGRSSELYELESIDSNKLNQSNADESHQPISLTTFNGLTIFPRFQKRPDKLHENLIQSVGTTSKSTKEGPASELTKLLTHVKDLANGVLRNPKSDLTTTASEPIINVFTVASGLLYERMAYLMCVSVMRHTRSAVKFWFISNFLSPSFKRFIPHLAREYGFDYQLVTYRWPSWLRAQKEKQRVIWGYKILFLDVLFPLEVDRVIFVDSDQIVRTDLKALVELDLMGAPYAYAPMCNDRNETKGFRFWDTGYWKESLQGRPYHISALYVVDLRVFRAVAAGDQLRQHYQALSADPGSLANLDQDLPNNMQSILPIFTLDQSWLWCETWCSDDGLKIAKTIDLCNNPLTHEPKLKRARRLIPEWDIYDQEVAKLAERIKKYNQNDELIKITIQAGEKIQEEEEEDQLNTSIKEDEKIPTIKHQEEENFKKEDLDTTTRDEL